MKFFIDKQNRYLLLTNFKVMYSTMTKQHNLINHSSQLFSKELVLDSLYNNKVEKFFIARNPYDRVVSCYFNKLVENDISSSFILQHCQKMLLPFFNIDSSELPEIERELKKIFFSKFVSQLRFFYHLDDHYLPPYSLELIPSIQRTMNRMKKYYFLNLIPRY